MYVVEEGQRGQLSSSSWPGRRLVCGLWSSVVSFRTHFYFDITTELVELIPFLPIHAITSVSELISTQSFQRVDCWLLHWKSLLDWSHFDFSICCWFRPGLIYFGFWWHQVYIHCFIQCHQIVQLLDGTSAIFSGEREMLLLSRLINEKLWDDYDCFYHAYNTSNHNRLLWRSSEVECTSNPRSKCYQLNIWIFNWWVEYLIPLYFVQGLIWVWVSKNIYSFLQLNIQLLILPLFYTCTSYHLKSCTLKMMMCSKMKYSHTYPCR
jgi:hypothetical protein